MNVVKYSETGVQLLQMKVNVGKVDADRELELELKEDNWRSCLDSDCLALG